MSPDQKARQEIDRHLQECGWVVQSFRDMNISAGPGIAVREFLLKTFASPGQIRMWEKYSSWMLRGNKKPRHHAWALNAADFPLTSSWRSWVASWVWFAFSWVVSTCLPWLFLLRIGHRNLSTGHIVITWAVLNLDESLPAWTNWVQKNPRQ